MAVAYNNQKVVTDGLVLYYDMFNTQKSWKGEPTVNQLLSPNDMTDSGVWAYAGATATEHKLVETSESSASWILQNSSVTLGLTYTQSVSAKYSERRYIQIAPSSGFSSSNYVNFDLLDKVFQVYGSGDASMVELSDGWVRCSFSVPATTTTSGRFAVGITESMGPGRLPVYVGIPGYGVFLKEHQFEQKSYPTPFVLGERTTTQAVLDLTKNETITAADLTYSSENTFSFTKNTDRLSFPNPIVSSSPYTIIQWVRASAALPDTTASGSRKTPMVGPSPTWNPGYWLTARVFRVHAATEYRDYTINWVNDTSWHMIGQTFDGTTVKHIIDGDVFLGTRTAYAPPAQTTIYVGSETVAGSTPSWKGDLPTIMFYDRKLSDAEVRNIFDATKHRYGI